jgi:hypothetical protein
MLAYPAPAGRHAREESKMKKLMLLGLVLLGVVMIAASAAALTVTVNDDTLILRWVKNTATKYDDNDPNDTGWYDYIGGAEFDTSKAEITYTGNDVIIRLFTSFSGRAGYGLGIDRGWSDDYLYHPADLAIDLDEDGFFEFGVALSYHSNPPQDPRSGGDIPGADTSSTGMPNPNTFFMSNYFSVDKWYTPDDIHRTTSSVGQMYDMEDPKLTPTWMYQGTSRGATYISWTPVTTGGYVVEIPLYGINYYGDWDSFNFLWGTATCGNDVIYGHAEVPEPATVLLLGLGLLGFIGWRRRTTGN